MSKCEGSEQRNHPEVELFSSTTLVSPLRNTNELYGDRHRMIAGASQHPRGCTGILIHLCHTEIQ